jgi:HTH-type transcriptional regulator/antitoxin HigA
MSAKTKSHSKNPPGGEHLPDYAVPPGATITEALEERGMNQRDLAARLGIQDPVLSDLIHGKRPITPETARGLELVLRIPMAFWLRAEARYREHKARLEEVETYREWGAWSRGFPLREMMNFGWIPEIPANDLVARVKALLGFLRVATPEAWSGAYSRLRITYRKSRTFPADENHLGAWLRQGENEALEMELPAYNRHAFRAALREIREWSGERGDVPLERIQKACAACGVALIYTPALPKSRAAGASRWLGAGRPLIQLSLRGKTDDHFWFTLFHEVAHVLEHGHKEIFVGFDDSEDQNEIEANKWAADHLIPPTDWSGFLAGEAFDSSDILKFAKSQRIAPGIVVGRLQREGKIPNSAGNKLKKTVDFPIASKPAASSAK